MIYELRTYWAAPDKIEALHARFRNVTLRLFARHQMHVIGFWTPAPITPESGDLVYMLAFPDQAALTQAWEAFRADPDWQAGRAAGQSCACWAARQAQEPARGLLQQARCRVRAG